MTLLDFLVYRFLRLLSLDSARTVRYRYCVASLKATGFLSLCLRTKESLVVVNYASLLLSLYFCSFLTVYVSISVGVSSALAVSAVPLPFG